MPDWMTYISTWLAQHGISHASEIVLTSVGAISVLNMLLPQPAPGSHWLPLRKLISYLAFNFMYAKDAGQPPLMSWVQRILIQIAAASGVPRDPLALSASLSAKPVTSTMNTPQLPKTGEKP